MARGGKRPNAGRKSKADKLKAVAADKTQPLPVRAEAAEAVAQIERPKPEANKGGRPTLFTAELAEAILDRMWAGDTLTSICAAEGMPDPQTVRKWARNDAHGFGASFARAREEQAHALFDRARDIADDGSRDYKEIEGKDGKQIVVVDHDHIQRSKLRVETYLRAAAKLLPREYGEKLDLTVREDPLDKLDEDGLRKRARELAAGLGYELQTGDGARTNGSAEQAPKPH